MTKVFSPVYIVDHLGELAKLPDGSIINIGGVAGPNFTVGGRPLIFADGSSTDGSDGLNLNISLQNAYDKSVEALIELSNSKDLAFKAENGNQLIIDSATGTVTITGDLVVQGELIGDLSFAALDISANTENLTFVTGSNVQEALESIDQAFKNIVAGESTVRPFEHVQDQASNIWIIPHNRNSRRIQMSIWDIHDELIFSDYVKIVDNNTVVITFSTPVVGRAVLMIF